jgi:cytochrome d ubiquinol oxidase subunit I
VANSLGWIFTEMGRQPWVVYGLQQTSGGVSRSVGAPLVLTTMVGFTLVYLVLAVITVYLMLHHGRAGITADEAEVEPSTGPAY